MAWAPSAEPANCSPRWTQWPWVSWTCWARSRYQGIQPIDPSDRAILILGNFWHIPPKIQLSMNPAGRMQPIDMLAMNGELLDTLYMVDDDPMWMDST